MTTINQLLKVKRHGYLSVGPDETVYEAIKLMADEDVGSLLVMDGDAPVDIVTERHYARDVILKGRTSPQTLVRDIMETEVACIEPDETVEACLRLMTEETRTAFAGCWWWARGWHRFDRRSREEYHRRAAFYHRPAGDLHSR
jgi:CBS domain-containing protein